MGDEADAEPAKEGKHRHGLWRDRLKEKANKLTKGRGAGAQQDQDVADFLRSGSSTSINSEAKINPTPPRIDTGTLGMAGGVAPEDRLEPIGFPTGIQPRKRYPKPPGIHVTFTHQEPDVIGEGGDEAELPANQVIGSWAPPSADASTHGRVERKASIVDPPPILQAGPQTGRVNSLQRAPTGLKVPEGSWAQKRASMSQEEGLVQAKKESWADDLVLREPTLPKISLDLDMNIPGTVATLERPPSPSLAPAAAPLLEQQSAQQPAQVAAPAMPQTMEAKPYVMMQNQGDGASQYVTSPPNGSEKQTNFLAYNPSLRQKDGASLASTREPTHALSPGPMAKASTDPSESVYPSGAKVPQSSHDNLLHQPKLRNELSPFPSPSYDQYGEMPSIHDVSKSTPEAVAADDFHTRMQHMRGIFRLTAERPGSLGANNLGRWLRASIWWFLRGRTELDAFARHMGSKQYGHGEDNLPANKQCYVDMAKGWWVLEDVIPGVVQSTVGTTSPTDATDGLEGEELLAVLHRTQWEMSRYFLKLNNRGLLPPSELLVQGADPEIWISYPTLPPGLHALTACLNPRTLTRQAPVNPAVAFSMPLNDSESTFSYGRFFGLAHVLGDDQVDPKTPSPCMVSIIRDRAQMLAEFLVTSQDGQINLHIQSDKKLGPTWSAVKWNARANSMLVVLMGEIAVEVQLREPDFRALYGVHDYNHKLESERLPRADEELLFGDHVQAFHFMCSKEIRTGFPPTPVQDCKVRLFQKTFDVEDAAGARRIFHSYRLSVASPPTAKTLSNMSRILREDAPILFNNLRGEGGAPALALVMVEGDKPASLIFTFETSIKRAAFHTILAGTATSPDECFSEDIPMHSMGIADLAGLSNPTPALYPMPEGINWQRLKVINLGSNLDDAPCIFSDRLRICMACNFGSITDRINLSTGELRIGLDPNDTTTIKLYRPAQNSMTISFLETSVRSKSIAQLTDILAAIAQRPTVRIYRFLSLPVLHDFQALATGHSVLYDGQATYFSIARRRMFGSHKHLETDHARLQILQAGQKMMMVAFFKNFAAGKCMSFELRGTDVYESGSQSGKFMVRCVEARFTLPRPASEEGHDLVYLDGGDHAAEHEDVVLGFDTEDDREIFARALPAALSKGSRMASFRRG